MELRQLEYFLAIAKCENMTQAAKAIHISQPSLSANLRDLEKELGFQLFNRMGKHLELNESGRYYAKRVQEALDILEEARKTAKDSAQARESIVNCAVEIPVGHAGELLRTFHNQHPDIIVRMGYPDSSTFSHQIIDIKLFGSQLKIEEDNTVLLGKEQYVAILPSDSDLAKIDHFKLSMLRDKPFILTNPSDLRTTVTSMCYEAGFEPKIVAETQLYSEALSLVESGIGYTVGTTFTWLGRHHFNVSVKVCEDIKRYRYLYANLNNDIETSEATKTFIEFLKEYSYEITQPYEKIS